MSYALETKKRKFDRILEALTDGSSQPRSTSDPRVSLGSRNDVANSSRISSVDSSKRQRVSPSLGKPVTHNSLVSHYLPSSRAAFLERLETYRHITKWHIPSISLVNAAEWAKRGWICVDVDTVSCGACSEKLTVDLSIQKDSGVSDEQENENGSQEQEDRDNLAMEFQEALVKRYQQMIRSSHAGTCPWRKRGCDKSIQRIEGLLTTSNTVSSMHLRYESIIDGIDECPAASDLPAYDVLSAPQMGDYDGLDLSPFQPDVLKLSLCGWQYKEDDVVECRYCFRSLGLWLYRGENPTVEHLEAIESHLEYCPWRSAEAQDTELMVHSETSTNAGKKLQLPGWVLVYHAVKKQTLRKQGKADAWIRTSHESNGEPTTAHLSPEQRDKKMKDLMRRIKEIKKPFNVKSLLRRKDKVDV